MSKAICTILDVVLKQMNMILETVFHECVIDNGYNMDDEIIFTDLAIEMWRTENIYGIKIFVGSAI